MGSLADLNSYSEEPISFTDNRAAAVIFTVPVPEDQETITSTLYTFTVFRPYEIIEIIRPELTNVTYSVDVSAVAGTTVTWATIPSGSTVTAVNGVYTINGIDSLDKWDTVKDPTITVPTTFNGSFFYTISVNYVTAQGLQTYEWQVGSYIPQVLLETAAAQNTIGRRIRFGVGAFNAVLSQLIVGDAFENGAASLLCSTALTAIPNIRIGISSNLNALFTRSILGDRVYIGLSNATGSATYSTNTNFKLSNTPTVLGQSLDQVELRITPSDTNAYSNVQSLLRTFEQDFTLTNPDPDNNETGDYFGSTVKINQDYILVSSQEAQSGLVALFNKSGVLQHYKTVGSGTTDPAISLSNNRWAVYDADGDSFTPDKKVLVYNNTTGSLVYSISCSDFVSSQGIFLNENYLVFGTPGYNPGSALSSGRLFVHNAVNGSLIYTKENPNIFGTAQADTFGSTVRCSNNYFATSAPLEDNATNTDGGVIYIFDFSTGNLIRTINNPINELNRFGDFFDIDDNFVYAINRIWSISTGNVVFTLPDINGQRVTIFKKDGAYLYCLQGGNIHIYDTVNNLYVSSFDDGNGSNEFDVYNNEAVIALTGFNTSTVSKSTLVTATSPSVNLNSTTKVITLNGTVNNVDFLVKNALVFTPTNNYSSNYTLSYQTTNDSQEIGVIRTQNVNNV